MNDTDQFDQMEETLFTAGYLRLLGWCGASLATVGITLNFGPDVAAKLAVITVGLIGMAVHWLRSRANLKTALKMTPPPSAPAKMISLPPAIQAPTSSISQPSPTPSKPPVSNLPIPK